MAMSRRYALRACAHIHQGPVSLRAGAQYAAQCHAAGMTAAQAAIAVTAMWHLHRLQTDDYARDLRTDLWAVLNDPSPDVIVRMRRIYAD